VQVTSAKAIRLDQLTDEIRVLPGLSGLQGLSAFSPTSEGVIEIAIHVGDAALSAEEERAIGEAIARHVPDTQWNASRESKELAAILARPEGALSPADIERALRILAMTIGRVLPSPSASVPATDGSDRA